MSEPFGIKIHGNLDGIEIVQDLGGNKYQVLPPRPHPQFFEYYVQTAPSLGVVWVKAVSPEFPNDGYGNDMRLALERVSEQLQTRYGPPRKVDFAAHDALWTDSRDWVMSLHQNERHFFHAWEREKGAGLPADLDVVFLGALTYGPSQSAVQLEYSSSQLAAAQQQSDQDLANLL